MKLTADTLDAPRDGRELGCDGGYNCRREKRCARNQIRQNQSIIGQRQSRRTGKGECDNKQRQ